MIKIKKLLRQAAASALPESFKEILFRKSFSLMSESQRDSQRAMYQMASMDWSLRNMRMLGFKPCAVLDIGAYHGDWTRLAKDVFPEATILMIEAQKNKEIYLSSVAANHPDSVFYKIALLGAESKTSVNFYEMESGSSVLYEQSNVERQIVTQNMSTLDGILQEFGWDKVDLMKIDVQGYELEVLKGGEKALEQAEAVLMEVSLLGFIKDAPLLHDVVGFMRARGFFAYDVCSFIRRPLDNALCQTDIIFVKETSALLREQQYGI